MKKEHLTKLKSRRWRLRHLYRITDKSGKEIPFVLTAEQEYFDNEQHTRNVILKARQLGFTTLVCIKMLDLAIFEHKKCALIAHTLDDAKRLFREKVEFAYDRLPEQIRLANPVKLKNTGEIVFEKGGSVTVDTSFRGGTLQYLHVSEMGKISKKYPEKAKEIVTGALPAVGIKGTATFESTAEGREGYFFDICQQAEKDKLAGKELTALSYKFFFFPWYQNKEYVLDAPVTIPERLDKYFNELEEELGITITPAQRNWYTETERTQGAEMKREYPSTSKEAFEQSIEGAYYAEQFTTIRKERRLVSRIPDNPHLPVNTYWDLGVSDSTSIWFVRRISDKEYHVIDYYENSGEGIEHYMKVLRDKGYTYGEHYAPHDVETRSLSNRGAKNLKQVAKEGFDGLSIDFKTVDRSFLMPGIEFVRKTLALCYFDEQKCERGINCLEAYHKTWNDKTGAFSDRPAHDWSSHGADAFRYFAVSLNLIKPVKNIRKMRLFS